MDNGINYSRYLERYLDNEADSDERLWIDKELAGNPTLQDELRFRGDVNKALAETDVLNLRLQLEELHQEAHAQSPQTGKRVFLWISSATGIAASTLLAWNLISRQPSDPQTITDTYFHPYENTLNFRSAGNTMETTLKQALSYYENEQYSEAINLFETLLATDSMQATTNFYSGISYMELENYESANRNLDRVILHNDNLFVEHAEWYLGFCYLMTDHREKAIQQFELIAHKDSYYKNEAKSVLKRLK